MPSEMILSRVAQIVGAVALVACRIDAQAPVPHDTVVARVLAPAVFEAVAEAVAHAAFDMRPRALRVRMPGGIGWQQIEAHLMIAMRGRARIASDTLELVVSVNSVQFVGDSLSA